jgi:bacterioferritin-associated ferredoxin
MSKHYGQLIANNQMAIAEQMQRIEQLQQTKGNSKEIAKCKRQIKWHQQTIAKLMSELRQQPTFHELPRTVA